MIEILETKIENDINTGQPGQRSVEVIITSGPSSYLLSIGGLPLTGNLQTILDAREAELWTQAQAGGRVVDLYEITLKRSLRAFASVMLDEINILRVQAGLQPRTAAQAEAALRAKLKGMS